MLSSNSWVEIGQVANNFTKTPINSYSQKHMYESYNLENIPEKFKELMDWVNTLRYGGDCGKFNNMGIYWSHDGNLIVDNLVDPNIKKNLPLVFIFFGAERKLKIKNSSTLKLTKTIKSNNGKMVTVGGSYQDEFSYQLAKTGTECNPSICIVISTCDFNTKYQ